MSAPDHELALDIGRRLQLAQIHGNPGHVLLALKAAGHAVSEHGAEALPEALAAVGEALPALAQALDPENASLPDALGFTRVGGRHGHQLRAAVREYEWQQLLAEVETVRSQQSLSTRAACREVARANGVNPASLRDQVLAAVAGISPQYPTIPSVPDDEASPKASAVLVAKI